MKTMRDLRHATIDGLNTNIKSTNNSERVMNAEQKKEAWNGKQLQMIVLFLASHFHSHSLMLWLWKLGELGSLAKGKVAENWKRDGLGAIPWKWRNNGEFRGVRLVGLVLILLVTCFCLVACGGLDIN